MGESRLQGAFHVLVPVKPLHRAKSRLEVDPAIRRTLALAFVLDTVASLRACRLVGDLTVVTRDPEVSELVRSPGVSSVSPPTSLTGLNPEVGWALQEQATQRRPTAVTVADLPAATPDEFEAALTAVHRAARAAHVPDLRDGGTTLIGSRWGGELVPQFGSLSSQRFLSLGHAAVGLDQVGVRCDVDTLESLRLASYMGAGPHTRAAVRDHLDAVPGRPTIRQSG